MENQQIEKPTELKIAPVLSQSLRFIAEHRSLPVDPERTERKYCLLEDSLAASDMSQRYYLNALTVKHIDAIRILPNSKSARADGELSQIIAETPELTGFDLSLGDPGAFYLDQKMMTGIEVSKIPDGTKFIGWESSQECHNLSRVMIEYSFYKERKKKFSAEFKFIEAEMKVIVDKYRLPIRLSWNASVDKTARTKRTKPDSSYLKKYQSQNS